MLLGWNSDDDDDDDEFFTKFQPNNIWETIKTQNKDVGPEDGGIPLKLVDRITINSIMTYGTLGYK